MDITCCIAFEADFNAHRCQAAPMLNKCRTLRNPPLPLLMLCGVMQSAFY